MVLLTTERETSSRVNLEASAGSVMRTVIDLDRYVEFPSEGRVNVPPRIVGVQFHGDAETVSQYEWLKTSKRADEERTKPYIPRLQWPPNANPVLTDKVRTLLRKLWAVVMSRAAQSGFPVRKAVVDVFSDPNEGNTKAILRLTCEAKLGETLAFWDSLEPDLQLLLDSLTEYERKTFNRKISLRMYWQ
ncbi:MAG: hypothetical protein HYX90_00545 [Chloroflexi bacterium]|nr:hypothetical protein [Chloroflexota bacterium]